MSLIQDLKHDPIWRYIPPPKKKLLLLAAWTSYLSCLYLGLLYTDTLFEPIPSMGGFLFSVIFLFHPGFAANIFFPIALITRPRRSIIFASVGLLLASSFLVVDSIYSTFKGPSWLEVIGFGWGYMLWLWAFIFLIADRVLQLLTTRRQVITLLGITLSCLLLAAMPSIFTKLDRDLLLDQRAQIFDQYCERAGIRIGSTLESPPDGIYFGRWARSMDRIEFDDRLGRLTRFQGGYDLRDYLGLWEVDSEESAEVGIYVNSFRLESDLSMTNYSVFVLRMEDEAVIADYFYVLDEWNGRLCAENSESFDSADFYKQVFPFAEFE